MTNIEKLRAIPSNELITRYKECGSIQKTLSFFGISGKSRYIQQQCTVLLNMYDSSVVKNSAIRNKYGIDDIKQAVIQSLCMSDVVRLLNLSTHGANISRVRAIIKYNNIDTSHFNVKQTMNRNKLVRDYDSIFCENSSSARSNLRSYVIKFGVLEQYCCAECNNNGTHNGKNLTLTIDHINGVSNDNRVNNLRWLCPNCHSQTDTYCGKNK